MALEKAHPELNRREILRNYTNPRGQVELIEERVKTPDEEIRTPIQTHAIGQTVTIKRSESKLEKNITTKKLSEMTPADYGIEGLDIEAELAALNKKQNLINQPSPATEKILAEATAEYSSKPSSGADKRQKEQFEELEREVNQIMAEYECKAQVKKVPADYAISPGTIDQINNELDAFNAKKKLPMPSLKKQLTLSDDEMEETVRLN